MKLHNTILKNKNCMKLLYFIIIYNKIYIYIYIYILWGWSVLFKIDFIYIILIKYK